MGNPLWFSPAEKLTLTTALKNHKVRLETDPYYQGEGMKYVRECQLQDTASLLRRIDS